MNIAIIGTGCVGGPLAQRLALAGQAVRLGVRDLTAFKGRRLLALSPPITAHPTAGAVAASDVVLVAAVPQTTYQLAETLGDATGKVIIDAMNSGRTRPDGYPTSQYPRPPAPDRQPRRGEVLQHYRLRKPPRPTTSWSYSKAWPCAGLTWPCARATGVISRFD